MFTNRAAFPGIDATVPPTSLSPNSSAEGARLLLVAVQRQDADAVREVLALHPASVRYRDGDGNTALHLAIRQGCNLDIVDMLLDARADPAVVDADGNTCLHLAFALRPPVPVLPEKLLQGRWRGDGRGLGAIGHRNAAGKTALALARDATNAVAGGYQHAVQQVEAALVEWMSGVRTSLRAAVAADDAPATRQLIDGTGWQLDAPLADGGANVVFHAILSGAAAVVVELGRIAAHRGRLDILNATDATTLLTPLIAATIADHGPIVKILIDAGANVDQRNGFGFSALHFAAQRGNAAMIDMLLHYRADPEARSGDGITPIMFAAEAGKTDIIKTLQLAGGNVNARDADGKTPMMYAHLGNHWSTALRIGTMGGRNEAVDNQGHNMSYYVALGIRRKQAEGKAGCTLL